MAQSHRMYPYFKNNRFSNFPGEKQESLIRSGFMLLESLMQRTRCLKDFKRTWVIDKSTFSYDSNHASLQPLVTWIGHATFVIQVGGLTMATDPIFGNPSTLFQRITRPGIALEHLPKIDIVLLSHNHRDHMHPPSLRAIAQKNPDVRILVPLGDKQWFKKNGFKHVQEYTWWDSVDIPGARNHTIKFSFLPAIHWSGRGLFDRNRSLWGSWMIESSEHTLYFGGDTAYGKHFKAIAQEFPQIDTALMPIGPCEPHEDMKLTHVSAEEAGQGFLELNAHRFIPMHWGVYKFGTDYPLLPVERLQKWWAAHNEQLDSQELNFLKFGESIECKRVITPFVSSVQQPKQPQI